MNEPTPNDQPANSRSKRRRVIFILLSIALLGLIGFGSLQVIQQRVQNQAVKDAPESSSISESNDHRSGSDSNAEKTQPASLASEKEKNSDTDANPDSQSYETAANNSDRLVAEQQAGLSISGAVLDDTGNLLPGISVLARTAAEPGIGNAGSQTGAGGLRQQTDKLGSFIFENLSEGEYDLTVAENDQYHTATLRVRAGLSNAELVLQRIRSVRIYGTITDDVGNPLESVRVWSLGDKLRVLSDSSGGYEILTSPSKAGQPPVLDFSLEGYSDARERVDGVIGSEASEFQLDIQLEWEPEESKVAVYGLIFGPAGEPVGRATVWLRSPELDIYKKRRSSALGEYRFKDVKVGDAYTLGVERQDEYAAFKSEALSVGPGDLNYDVWLETAGFADLSGTVTDLEGAPLSDFMVWLRSLESGSHEPMPLQTDGAGQFQLKQIPSGAIKFETRSQPWLEASGIELKPGESRRVTIPLDWGQDWLLGQVVDEQGGPVSRAKVVLQWNHEFFDVRSKSRREVMCDQGGYFAVSNLGAREYSVTVQATGYELSRTQYRLGQSGEELRIILSRSGSVQRGNGGH